MLKSLALPITLQVVVCSIIILNDIVYSLYVFAEAKTETSRFITKNNTSPSSTNFQKNKKLKIEDKCDTHLQHKS